MKTEWGKDLTNWIVENVDIVTVRDISSKKLLEKIAYLPKTIHLLPDSTIGARSAEKAKIEKIITKEGIKIKKGKKKIAIGLRNLCGILPTETAKKVLTVIADCLNKYKNQATYIFIPQSTYEADDDRQTAMNFVKLLDDDADCQIIKKRYDPRELIGLYGLCDFTLSIRLHSAVFSTIAATPVIAINYLPKVEGFMNSMKIKDFCININDVRQEKILNIFKKLEIENDIISNSLKIEIKRKRKEVGLYSDLLSDCF